MIICRTPFRISFFGGGTDYPQWVSAHGGAVLSTTIDKYCTITCRRRPAIFPHRNRIVYRLTEEVQHCDEVQHPLVREVMRHLGVNGIELHYDGDLPGQSGVGSSSAFTVGLLHTLYALKGQRVSKRRLAEEAVMIEQEKVGDLVGSQDQFSAAFGGFNHIVFPCAGPVEVHPVIVSARRAQQLNDHLLLLYSGRTRFSSEVVGTVIDDLEGKAHRLSRLGALVDEGLEVLLGDGDLGAFGELLHESWLQKRELSDAVSTPEIDRAYEAAREVGAIGGKLVGAGGGGFLLLFAKPERHSAIRKRVGWLDVPIAFERAGSQIIFFSPQSEVNGAGQE